MAILAPQMARVWSKPTAMARPSVEKISAAVESTDDAMEISCFWDSTTVVDKELKSLLVSLESDGVGLGVKISRSDKCVGGSGRAWLISASARLVAELCTCGPPRVA